MKYDDQTKNCMPATLFYDLDRAATRMVNGSSLFNHPKWRDESKLDWRQGL